MDWKHFYTEKGTGTPFILLHGNGEDSTYFCAQVEEFSKHYRVIALDTRGHGKTPRGTKPFTIRQFADDLLGFMDAHGIPKAHILGFSDGANIAMIFAMRYADRVDRLILNGGNLDARGVKWTVQFPIEVEYRLARMSKRESARRKAELLGLMVNDPNIKPDKLSAISARTLVIAGTNDMIKDKHTRLIAACIPNARLTLVKGDHFIAGKQPEEFNREILRFLRG